jgi:hypothetical protein
MMDVADNEAKGVCDGQEGCYSSWSVTRKPGKHEDRRCFEHEAEIQFHATAFYVTKQTRSRRQVDASSAREPTWLFDHNEHR